MNGNDLVEHIERCDKCKILEDFRQTLIDLDRDKWFKTGVFDLITNEQMECLSEENNGLI